MSVSVSPPALIIHDSVHRSELGKALAARESDASRYPSRRISRDAPSSESACLAASWELWPMRQNRAASQHGVLDTDEARMHGWLGGKLEITALATH